MRLETPVETTLHKWETSDEYRSLLMNSRWGEHFEHLAKHNISQDNLPGEINFLTSIVPPRTPDLIGRDMCPIVNVTEPTTRFPVLGVGATGRSARGEQNYLSAGGRISYKNLTLQDSWNTNDTVDQDFIEDIQSGLIQYYWNELYRIHRENISQEFIDFLCPTLTAGNKTDPSGNSYTIESWQIEAAKTADMAGLLKTWQAAKENHINPDTLLCNYDYLSRLLQAEDFRSNELFQSMADYKNGSIGSILGLNIYASTQVPTGKYWVFEKQEYAIAGMRRDEMITNLQDNSQISNGLSISSRYGFAYRDPSRVMMATLAAE